MISEIKLHKIISESINNVLSEADRHREGYYQEYAKKTGKKDRHSPDYYKKYRERKKQEQQTEPNKEQTATKQKPKKDRREYYRKYNQEHPERLNRGFTKGYKNGNVDDGPLTSINNYSNERILGYDEFGMPITNHPLSDALRNKEMMWHDDDWCEDVD